MTANLIFEKFTVRMRPSKGIASVLVGLTEMIRLERDEMLKRDALAALVYTYLSLYI